jgi:tetratricopeptide (TPR) repeat protein
LPGGGNRPGIGGNRPDIGGPGPGLGGNRPGLGGNRPGIGGNRPGIGDLTGGVTTLPGTIGPNRPGIGGNRPGIGGDRPLGGNRPGIGGNRPGIGDGNNFWNSGNINSGNWNNSLTNINVNNLNRPWGGSWGYPGYGSWGGGWGYPGYGGGWAGAWNGGCVNPHYGWYNGCWGGGWWAPFAVGAATWGLASTVANWGLGYGAWGYSNAYVNPYYSAVPAAVVSASPYDYAQPVAVTTYAQTADPGAVATAPASTPADEVTEAERTFDEAIARFKAGDYTAALAGLDKAVRLSPKDTIVHEVRALALFALARYPEAAATLNAVLAAAPGMDWTTMSGLYGSVDTYTGQLRKLETFCTAHPDDAAAWFVLAYHYLVGGHNDMAAEALRVVVAKQPGDAVAKQLLAAVDPQPAAEAPAPATAPTPAADSGPETDLVGAWKASAGDDAVFLTIKEDSSFTWKAAPKGRDAVELSGTIETARDAIALVSEKAGTMTAKVVSKGPDSFEFTLADGPPGAKPLLFERQK